MSEITLQASAIRLLTTMHERVIERSTDQSNTGKVLASAFIWDVIAKYAKKQSELAWSEMEKDEIISYKGLLAGTENKLAESPKFVVIDKVSEPRKTFKPDVLVESLNKKYKVPKPIARELIEKAKVPGNSTHTCSIVER